MPLKKPARTSRPASVKASAKGTRHKRFPMAAKNAWQAGAIALGLLGVVAVGALFAARPQPVSQDTENSAAPVTTAESVPAVPKKPAAARVENPVPAVHATQDEAPAQGPVPAAVTITGCLQRADDAFRLNHTEGSAAPRARSWKSGFLKKSSASIDLMDPASSMRLADHVGERVSVTGTLVDRDMRVQSVRRLSKVCE